MQGILDTASNTCDILFLQEPWQSYISANESRQLSHPDFEMITPPNGTKARPARVAIFFSKINPHLRCTQTKHALDLDALSVELSTPKIESFVAVNIYNNIVRGDPSHKHTLNRLQNDWSLPERSLILGDFNAHHPLWNSDLSQPKNAADTLWLMENLKFGLINEPDVLTHYPMNANTPSVIDLALATPPLLEFVSD